MAGRRTMFAAYTLIQSVAKSERAFHFLCERLCLMRCFLHIVHRVVGFQSEQQQGNRKSLSNSR